MLLSFKYPIFYRVKSILLFICLNLLFVFQTIAQSAIKDSIRAANQLYKQSDYTRALKLYYKVLSMAERVNDSLHTALCYTNIACLHNETEKMEFSEKFAKRAISILEKMHYPEELGNAYNALAVSYYQSYKDSSALHFYRKAIEQWSLSKDTLGLFSGYKNLGALSLETGDTAGGIAYLKHSIKYIRNADLADTKFSAYMTLGEALIYNNRTEEGKNYLREAGQYIPLLTGINKLDDYYYAWHYYYKKKKDFAEALTNFELYKKYADSISNQESTRQILELNVKYETEKKDNKIHLQELALAQEREARFLLILSSTAGLAFLILLFIMYRQHQRRKTDKLLRAQEEKNVREIFEAEQNERIRIARDLHDSIGQKLSVIKMLLPEHNDNPELKKISGYVDETAREVRTISHNLIPEILNFGLLKALEELTDQINQSHKIKVDFSSALDQTQLFLSKRTELSVYRIIQEILNNIIKHAQTQKVSLKLTVVDNFIQIFIADFGRGFEISNLEKSEGIGWKNIFARIKLINGNIDIHSDKNKGSQFLINVPII